VEREGGRVDDFDGSLFSEAAELDPLLFLFLSFSFKSKKKKNSTPTTALSPSSLFFLLLSRAPSLDLPKLRFALIIPERLRKKISVS
jgi:hypothetical protein